jgi:hypothetical protein
VWGDVAELRLDVGERGEISDVLCRLRGCVASSSLSVAKQLNGMTRARTPDRSARPLREALMSKVLRAQGWGRRPVSSGWRIRLERSMPETGDGK